MMVMMVMIGGGDEGDDDKGDSYDVSSYSRTCCG